MFYVFYLVVGLRGALVLSRHDAGGLRFSVGVAVIYSLFAFCTASPDAHLSCNPPLRVLEYGLQR